MLAITRPVRHSLIHAYLPLLNYIRSSGMASSKLNSFLDSLFTLLACLLIISTTVRPRPRPQTITTTGSLAVPDPNNFLGSGAARLRYWCLESSQPAGFGPSIFASQLDSSEDITFTIQFTDDEASVPVLAP